MNAPTSWFALFAAASLAAACNPAGYPPSQEETPVVAEAPAEDYDLTPFGRFHRSCTHDVPSGAQVDTEGRVTHLGKTIQQLTPCPYPAQRSRGPASSPQPLPANWIEWIETRASTNAFGFDWFNHMSVEWDVPANPAFISDQLLYFFPGFEPLDRSVIIQPVLQWGRNGDTGGPFWIIRSYWVDSGNNQLASDPIVVNPGDRIQGLVNLVACHNGGVCTWRISTLLWRNGDFVNSTELLINSFSRFRYAFKGVVEVYRTARCDQYPSNGSLVFRNPILSMPGPGYTDFNLVQDTQTWTGVVKASATPACAYDVLDLPDQGLTYMVFGQP